MVMSRDHRARRIHKLNIDNIQLKGWDSSNIWEKPNESKFYSGRNYGQIEVRECLLTFGAESFVFQVAIQKYKD